MASERDKAFGSLPSWLVASEDYRPNSDRDGFLARHGDPLDRRKLLVRLSAKGEAAAATLVDEHAQWIASLFADFTPDEMQLLSGLLEKAWRKTDRGAA